MKKYICLLMVTGIMLSAAPGSVFGQSSSGSLERSAVKTQASQPPSSVSLKQIEALQSTLESSQDIPEDMKTRALGILGQAKNFLELAASYAEQAVDAAASIKTAPERIKQISVMLETTVPSAQEALRNTGASEMPLESVEQELRRAEVELSDAQANYAIWSDKQSQHALLLQQLRDTQAQASQRLEKIRMELAAEPVLDKHVVVADVKHFLLLAEQNKCKAELALSKQQLVGYDVLGALYVSERDLAAREVMFNQAVLEAWQKFAQKMREQGAAQAREDAMRIMLEKAERFPALKAEYDSNIELGRQLESIIKDDAANTKKLKKQQARLSALEEVFKLAREWVEQDILTEAVSLMIHEQYNSLPSMFMFRRRIDQRDEMLGEIRDEQLSIEQKKRDLANLDEAVRVVFGSLEEVSTFEEAVLRQEIRILLQGRREILNKQDEAYRRLFKNINTYAFTDQQLMKTADEFKLFLATHLLWVRSAKPISSHDMTYLKEALAWVFSPKSWQQDVYPDFRSSLAGTPFRWGFCLIIFGLLLVGKRWARGELKRTAQLVRNFETDSFKLTLWVIVATTVLVLAWPFLFYTSGRILADMPFADSFTRDVCAGIKRVALWFAAYSFLYYLCHRDGLAKIHCRWSEASRVVIRRNIAWLMVVSWPFVFFLVTTEVAHKDLYQDSLGRFSFIILMVLMAAVFARILDLRKGIAAEKIKRFPGSWLSRLKYLWYGAAIAVPLVFAGLAVCGYSYTALMLLRLLHFSIWMIVVIVLLNDIVLRWLLFARLRLALERNQEKNAEQEETRIVKKTHSDTSNFSDEAGTISVKDEQVDLTQIDEQTRGLLRIVVFFTAAACLWAIWSEVLPALDLLDDISLWSYRETVDGSSAVPLSFGNLLWAIVLAIVVVVAARNLPGVLNITLFSRFSIDDGAQYALVTICRYIIVVVGVIVVVNSIGFRWESLQWLIAALGVGLGFGLQEIVANFICGLIILFERPFRLGDVVTSGDVSGKVTRIQIRATTITDWDRHELIVPNKEFITGRLINWTLSDPVVRVIVPVGVAYGSDTLLVEQLLMKVAVEAEIVLDEPEPRALFLGFGDSSLNFELRVFISGVNTMSTKHQLHMAIDQEFRKAGVTISFPQRDVHFDSFGPIDVRVVPSKGPEEETAG